MGRLVNTDELWNNIQAETKQLGLLCTPVEQIIQNVIAKTRTAEASEGIVKCKECMHWQRDGLSAISGNCEKMSHRERNSALRVEIERKTTETFYCADGERRDNK